MPDEARPEAVGVRHLSVDSGAIERRKVFHTHCPPENPSKPKAQPLSNSIEPEKEKADGVYD